MTSPGVAEMARMRAEAEAAEYPESIGDFVDRAASLHGERVLARYLDGGLELSYRQLAEATKRLASSFLNYGIRKGTHVAVMLPNVPAFALTWVALGRIGAVMVPVNTGYTQEELTFVLGDSDAQFVVIDAAFLETLDRMEQVPPLLRDRPAALIVHGGSREGAGDFLAMLDHGAPDFVAASPVGRNDLLNLQYTSGTTGFPKGCMLPHDYWILIGSNAARWRGATGDVKNVLIWAPFFYMDPQWQFLMAMALGGTAKIAPRMSLSKFYGYLRNEEIHYCIFPEPGLEAWPEGPMDRDVHLKYVSIFGWRAEAREEVQRRFGLLARESFGMTEIGGGTLVPSSDKERALQVTTGLPAAFRECMIADEDGNELPRGTVGELCVAGRGILWGYYKRPEANAASFRGKWFRTGDLFVQDEDGYLRIVGRIKDMIRRSGENIAAQEVEAALRAMDGVWEVAAVGVPDPRRGQEVKVYILPEEGVRPEDIPPAAILAHCESRLAKFKQPRFIEYVSEFPRTPSNKIRKPDLVAAKPDLRAGSWDRESGTWLPG